MARIGNPLALDLLTIAEHLAAQTGKRNLRQAALRRSVSTAYYALFHALCYVCTDGLVRWSRTDLVAKTYRSLTHADARRKLAALASRPGCDANLKRLANIFAMLQEQRHEADYERPQALFAKSRVLTLIAEAREAIDLLAEMQEDGRRALAIELLVAKPR